MGGFELHAAIPSLEERREKERITGCSTARCPKENGHGRPYTVQRINPARFVSSKRDGTIHEAVKTIVAHTSLLAAGTYDDILREFVKTHVILAPLREFSRSRAASKIPFPGAQPGKFGESEIFHFRCKNRYLRSRVI